ncbi:hypothetical protein STEG23_023352, partial [Scotinomys teguina]
MMIQLFFNTKYYEETQTKLAPSSYFKSKRAIGAATIMLFSLVELQLAGATDARRSLKNGTSGSVMVAMSEEQQGQLKFKVSVHLEELSDESVLGRQSPKTTDPGMSSASAESVHLCRCYLSLESGMICLLSPPHLPHSQRYPLFFLNFTLSQTGKESKKNSAQIWTCNSFRCGESRLEMSLCSCADDCLQRKDCCADYKTVCQGETPWVTEACATSQEFQCPEGFDLPPVILFSMDGFRAEYLQTWSTLVPNINKLKTCGIHSKYMRAMYPTKTFPNHYTIVTGLYPESHGIIDNNMYDVYFNKNFSLSSEEKNNPAWWSGQPIWLTAIYQGLKAAAYYWPGSDVAINGSFPTMYRNYSSSVPYERRISTLLKWLDLPKAERPSFYTLYVEEPDSAGHKTGPVSAGVIKALQLVDDAFGMLMEGLKQRNLHNCVNIILLADHGMDQTYCDKVEYMTDYFPQINFYMYQGPAPRIRTRNIPQDFFTFNSEEIIRNLSCRKPIQHFKPYLTPDLPKRLHYAKNVRIDKAHLLVDRQWLAMRTQSSSSCGGGTHGYNNEFKSMEAIFLAHGPSFKENTEIEPFENIEVYNLLCDLLRIQPAPNNGTHGSLNHLLKAPFYEPSHPRELSAPSGCGFTTPVPTDTLNCSCPDLNTDVQLEQANQMLNLTEGDIAATVKVNLPFGRPRMTQENKEHCVLYQRGYISGFGKAMKMPMWSSYTVPKP